jgi:hypothetical protein
MSRKCKWAAIALVVVIVYLTEAIFFSPHYYSTALILGFCIVLVVEIEWIASENASINSEFKRRESDELLRKMQRENNRLYNMIRNRSK